MNGYSYHENNRPELRQGESVGDYINRIGPARFTIREQKLMFNPRYPRGIHDTRNKTGKGVRTP